MISDTHNKKEKGGYPQTFLNKPKNGFYNSGYGTESEFDYFCYGSTKRCKLKQKSIRITTCLCLLLLIAELSWELWQELEFQAFYKTKTLHFPSGFSKYNLSSVFFF